DSVALEGLYPGQRSRVDPRPLVLYVVERVAGRQWVQAALIEAGRLVLGVRVAVDARGGPASLAAGHLVPPLMAERRRASMTRGRLLMSSVSAPRPPRVPALVDRAPSSGCVPRGAARLRTERSPRPAGPAPPASRRARVPRGSRRRPRPRTRR